VSTEEPRGFQFPCDYRIKAMGIDDGSFHEIVIEIIRRHNVIIREGSLRNRPSRRGKYVSVSLMIEATSREQLDAIYDDLTAHDKVLMRL
jgi:putative lipoic acid-binding regulatory protein